MTNAWEVIDIIADGLDSCLYGDVQPVVRARLEETGRSALERVHVGMMGRPSGVGGDDTMARRKDFFERCWAFNAYLQGNPAIELSNQSTCPPKELKP